MFDLEELLPSYVRKIQSLLEILAYSNILRHRLRLHPKLQKPPIAYLLELSRRNNILDYYFC
jgi:hypothetical protein